MQSKYGLAAYFMYCCSLKYHLGMFFLFSFVFFFCGVGVGCFKIVVTSQGSSVDYKQSRNKRILLLNLGSNVALFLLAQRKLFTTLCQSGSPPT